MSASVVSELQDAIIRSDPEAVRRLLDTHGTALKERPNCQKDGWSALHVLAKCGENYGCQQQAGGTIRENQEANTTSTLDSICKTMINNRSWEEGGRLQSPGKPPWMWWWLCEPSRERYHRARMSIVYMLVDGGVDVNGRDSSGLSPLHYAARRGDSAVCDVLIQCGADLQAQHGGVALWDEVQHAAQQEEEEYRLNKINSNLNALELTDDSNNEDEFEEQQLMHNGYNTGLRREDEEEGNIGPPKGPAGAVWQVFRFYWPGLWRAVSTQDISKVRRLVNTWCRVDLTRAGMTLRELAVNTGNESVISLLLSIQPSMCLVHHALAGNVPAVRELLESPARKKINIDIRKLSERGAPLLYFLIKGGQYQLIKELRSHGASPYIQMLDEYMVDIPVIFTALEPWIDPKVIKSLLPSPGSHEAMILERVWNRGKNVLRYAVENDVHIDAIEAILDVGGPALLCDCDPEGLTVADVALRSEHEDLVMLIDKYVALWLTRPDLYPGSRDLLALRGNTRLEVVAQLQENLDQDVVLFLQEFGRCQGVLEQMFQAVEEGEIPKAQQLLNFESDIFHLVDLLWQGRIQGDGMPLLHWAVLHGREQIVNLILRSPVDYPAAHQNNVTHRFCPDDLRDPWRRTPLHYAYGLPDGANIIAALLDLGSSEHTLDMDGHEPLDFRDARGSPALDNMLENLRNKIHDPPDPNPWDPEILRIHQNNQRLQRFQNHQRNPQLHHHHHHHHNQQFPQHGTPPFPNAPVSQFQQPTAYYTNSYGHSFANQHSPYPSHFPRAPGSNFQWPLPHHHTLVQPKAAQRSCTIM